MSLQQAQTLRRGLSQLSRSSLSRFRCAQSIQWQPENSVSRPSTQGERMRNALIACTARSRYHVLTAQSTAQAQAHARKRRRLSCRTEIAHLPRKFPSPTALSYSTKAHSSGLNQSAWIALGSNVGDRIKAIEDACRAIDADPQMHIEATSPLYETDPMYVEDQGRFLNGVCKIATNLEPMDLLDRLQAIENGMGRVKLIDKGPRNIDLDILEYPGKKIKSERLTIPHPLMNERAFVLKPLNDLRGPHSSVPSDLGDAQSNELMYRYIPLGPGDSHVRIGDPDQHGHIMAILNITPDSFSDGGDNLVAGLDALRDRVSAAIKAGATIIDIGGQSSRPNAEDVTPEEELSRVLPAIEAAKSLPRATNIAISVDTYRAKVAEAAIEAGAHIINDISAGQLDREMLPTIARLGCTYIMMHMRGTPATMQSEKNTHYPDGLIPTVSSELLLRLAEARTAGIRQWRIIIDPGFGFAKTVDQNVEMLANLQKIRQCDGRLGQHPFLIGLSRKSFIGKITGEEHPKERIGGTAAAVAFAATSGSAEIHRVHDVAQMAQALKMAAAVKKAQIDNREEEST